MKGILKFMFLFISITLFSQNSQRNLGNKSYEVSNHLGNVMAVVSDRKTPTPETTNTTIAYNETDIKSFNDYYPYGMVLGNRNGSSYYRFGFQGQVKDDEVKGSSNTINYTSRVYDPRLGRWFSIDPMCNFYPQLSPYSYAANSPLVINDEGGEFLQFVIKWGIDIAIEAFKEAVFRVVSGEANSIGEAFESFGWGDLWNFSVDAGKNILKVDKYEIVIDVTKRAFDYLVTNGTSNFKWSDFLSEIGQEAMTSFLGKKISGISENQIKKGLKKLGINVNDDSYTKKLEKKLADTRSNEKDAALAYKFMNEPKSNYIKLRLEATKLAQDLAAENLKNQTVKIINTLPSKQISKTVGEFTDVVIHYRQVTYTTIMYDEDGINSTEITHKSKAYIKKEALEYKLKKMEQLKQKGFEVKSTGKYSFEAKKKRE